MRGKVLLDGRTESAEAALHEQEDGLEHVAEVDLDGCLGLAVEGEHGAADLGDAAISCLARCRNCLTFVGRGFAVHEEEEVGDRVERVVDLVRDGGREASGDGELLVCQQSFLALDAPW